MEPEVFRSVIGIRIRDPLFFFTPGSRIRDGKIHSQDPGFGMNIPDLIFENLVSVFWVKNT
jgi:hypothetical protein